MVGTAKAGIGWFAPDKRPQVLALLDSFKPLCERHGCSLGNLAIAWTRDYAPHVNVLCGARKLEQLEHNALSDAVHLSEAERSSMDEAAQVLLRRGP